MGTQLYPWYSWTSLRVYPGVSLRYNMHLRALVHTLVLLYIIQHITIWQGILILQDNNNYDTNTIILMSS